MATPLTNQHRVTYKRINFVKEPSKLTKEVGEQGVSPFTRGHVAQWARLWTPNLELMIDVCDPSL